MSSQYSAYPGATGVYGPYSGPGPMASQGRPVDPIISRLRPRDLVGIIDQSFRLYRRHFLTFLAIIAVVHIPLQAAIQTASVFLIGDTSGFYTGSYSDLENSSQAINDQFTSTFVLIGALGVLSLLYGILMALSQAALTAAVADSHMDRPVSFGRAYGQVFRRIGPVFGLMLLEVLIYLAAFVPVILILLIGIGMLVSDVAGGSGSGGGSAALICLAFPLGLLASGLIIYVTVRLRVAVPALIVENLGPWQAIKRSWQLLNGYWWRTAGLMLILLVLNWVVSSGPATLVAALATIFIKYNPVLNQAITGAVTVLTTALFIPVELVAITLYYFDTRVRREGFDIETAVSQAYPNAYPQGQGGQYYPQQTQPQQPYPNYGYGYGNQHPAGQYGQPQQFGSPAYTQPIGNGGYEPTDYGDRGSGIGDRVLEESGGGSEEAVEQQNAEDTPRKEEPKG